MERNVHFSPIFEQMNETMNAGSVILMGDCYHEQVANIFQDAHLFDPRKIVISQRHTGQKPEKFVPVVGELKLFIMVFQSFNSGRLDERYEEIDHIFKALKKARETWGKTSSRAHRQGVLRPAALKGHEVFGRIVACNL